MANLKDDKADITKLYKDLIIKHASNPCNFGSLNSDAVRSTGINPLCGDKLEIYISTHKDAIEKIRFEGVGCAISVASASMLTEILKDKSIGATLKGEPIIIRDINKSDRLQYPDDAKKEGIGAIVSIPIKFYDKVIGAVRLYHHEVWDISEKDVDSLFVLARNIGLAMSYTRMLKTIKKIRYAIDEAESLW